MITGLPTAAGQPWPEGVKEQQLLEYGDSPNLRDPAFMENRGLPIHRWVPWVAGFSSGFVKDCLSAYLDISQMRKPLVLDPFAGVGTTLVTAMENGIDSIGFEINPYAVLACRTKLSSVSFSPSLLRSEIEKYGNAAKNGHLKLKGELPAGFRSKIPFFSPDVEEQVHGFRDYLRGVTDPVLSDAFRLAFGSVMVSFSNYSYEPSLSTRTGAGKPLIQQADVHGCILDKLKIMLADCEHMQKSNKAKPFGTGRIIHQNFLSAIEHLEEQSVELVVTSPPYLNNYHYIRSTRPHLYWLDLLADRQCLRQLEDSNIGKYWQTVRGVPRIELGLDDPVLERQLQSIRSTRQDKGVYGGEGWANYVAAYFNDTNSFLLVLSKLLRKGGKAVIVVGNSIIQGHEIKVDEALSRIASEHGLMTIDVKLLRAKRVGASITQSKVRRGESSLARLFESAVVLTR